jgi:hypothetical protein
MKFDLKHSYNKPAAAVLKMYSDKAFFERKYKDIGAWDVEVVQHEKSDSRFSIKCRYTVKNDAPLPDFAKKFLGESTVITQSDTWDLKKATGRLEIEIKGAPVKVSADMTLKDAGSGSSNEMKWNVSCGIPLIGGKLESVVGEDIKAKSKKDEAVSQKILASY